MYGATLVECCVRYCPDGLLCTFLPWMRMLYDTALRELRCTMQPPCAKSFLANKVTVIGNSAAQRLGTPAENRTWPVTDCWSIVTSNLFTIRTRKRRKHCCFPLASCCNSECWFALSASNEILQYKCLPCLLVPRASSPGFVLHSVKL